MPVQRKPHRKSLLIFKYKQLLRSFAVKRRRNEITCRGEKAMKFYLIWKNGFTPRGGKKQLGRKSYSEKKNRITRVIAFSNKEWMDSDADGEVSFCNSSIR